MMLIIRIRMGNAAFEEDQEGEVSRILAKVAAEYANLEPGYYHTLHDVNGNDCGEVGLIE